MLIAELLLSLYESVCVSDHGKMWSWRHLITAGTATEAVRNTLPGVNLCLWIDFVNVIKLLNMQNFTDVLSRSK